ncbi:MAG: 30S ribosomal protein S9 [Patescibacteria group bacterium]
MEVKKETRKYFQGTGRRKHASARVRLYEKGKGKFIVNDKKLKDFFGFFEYQQQALSPLKLTEKKDKLDVSVKVSGGGLRGQAEAIRHGIARALVEMDEELKPALRKNGYMTRDPRSKERKKPGLKRARRAPQWRKR